jgi:hypothetical protein
MSFGVCDAFLSLSSTFSLSCAHNRRARPPVMVFRRWLCLLHGYTMLQLAQDRWKIYQECDCCCIEGLRLCFRPRVHDWPVVQSCPLGPQSSSWRFLPGKASRANTRPYRSVSQTACFLRQEGYVPLCSKSFASYFSVKKFFQLLARNVGVLQKRPARSWTNPPAFLSKLPAQALRVFRPLGCAFRLGTRSTMGIL